MKYRNQDRSNTKANVIADIHKLDEKEEDVLSDDDDAFPDILDLKDKVKNPNATGQDDIQDDPGGEGYLESPCFSDNIHENQPQFLQNIVSYFDNKRKADIFITAFITILSGCLHKVRGFYDDRLFYPNLFSFVIAPPATGKSVALLARKLFEPYAKEIRRSSDMTLALYAKQLAKLRPEGKQAEIERCAVQKPPYKLLFIPGNITTTALYQQLSDNDGMGILFESEADVLGKMLKSEHGDSSALFRCASQNEPLSLSRVINDKRIEILEPKLAVFLSGTPGQVNNIVSSSENGLMSRFLYYRFNSKPRWNDVSPKNGKPILPQLIEESSEYLNQLILTANRRDIFIKLTDSQWQKHNSYFESELSAYYSAGEDIASIIYRLGLQTFKVAMIYTIIRSYHEETISDEIYCSDTDYDLALDFIGTYLQHSLVMLRSLPQKPKERFDSGRGVFYSLLPVGTFSRKDAIVLAVSSGLRLHAKTIDNYLKESVNNGSLVKVGYNLYKKTRD